MESTVSRVAGPNEKRCIIRHRLGFYSNLLVGTVYRVPRASVQESAVHRTDFYAPALAECIRQHPLLSATIHHVDTNEPIYAKPAQLNIQDHIRFLSLKDLAVDSDAEETTLLKGALKQLHNDPKFRFSSVESRPAWALDVLPLTKSGTPEHHRIFICFTYSHSHGDGMSGFNFQRTFYEGLQKSVQYNLSLKGRSIETTTRSLPDQPDTASNLPISLSYLLRPALGTYLPGFLTRLFGISGSISGADKQTWTGSRTFTDEKTPYMKVTTHVEIFEIEAETLAKLLSLCKKKNLKLTSLLDLVLAYALKSNINTITDGKQQQLASLVSTIPVNLRRVLSVPAGTVGNYGGAAYLRYDLKDIEMPGSDLSWQSLRRRSENLSKVASSAKNQPIGLLRFVSGFASWMQGQVGQSRDCSWELSNLGSFDPMVREAEAVVVEQMLFSQSASPVGPPLTFNAISVKDKSLSICVSWQPGALDLGQKRKNQEQSVEERDRLWVQRIMDSIKSNIDQLSTLS